MDTVTTIICSVLGSASLFTFIQFMINRHDDKNDRLQAIETQLKEIRNEIKSSNVDSVRTQMLLLISDYPDDVQEIMKCAEIYFKEMGGNWYMTSIFKSWLEKTGVANPDWFDGK